MLEEGKWLRVSALGHDGRVKVLFRNANDQTKAYFMPHATYQAILLLTNATPDDFAKHGELTPAKSLDLYENL